MPLVFSTALFLLPALAIFNIGSTSIISLAFSAIGIYYLIFFRKYSIDLKFTQEKPIFLSLFLLAALLIGLNIYHHERWSASHLPIAILLISPAFIAITQIKFNANIFWQGCAWGAILGFLFAFYEITFLHVDRAGFSVSNPIPFASIAMVLSAGAIIGFDSTLKKLNLLQLVQLIGFVAGIGAAVLSGSKGGLLVLPVLAFLFYIKCLKLQPTILKLWTTALLLAIFLLALFHPQVHLLHRVYQAFEGAWIWFYSGGVADDSFGPRLELIRFGVEIFQVSPWLGIGRNGMIDMIQTYTEQGLYDPFIANLTTLHNEFLNILVTKGLFSTFALAAVYFFSIKYFLNYSRHQDDELKNIGLMGVSFCIMFLIFGVGEVAIQLSFLRNFFLIFLMVLMGMAYRRAKLIG